MPDPCAAIMPSTEEMELHFAVFPKHRLELLAARPQTLEGYERPLSISALLGTSLAHLNSSQATSVCWKYLLAIGPPEIRV